MLFPILWLPAQSPVDRPWFRNHSTIILGFQPSQLGPGFPAEWHRLRPPISRDVAEPSAVPRKDAEGNDAPGSRVEKNRML